MNHIMKMLLLLLSLFLNAAIAQSDVYSLLNSGETKSLKQAAKILTRGEQNTLKNTSLLAAILEREFASAPTNRIDALAWGCTALGATGDGQYKDLLKRISLSKAHKKLRKYANKAYQRLPSTGLILAKKTASKPTVNNHKTLKIVDLPNKQNTDNLIPKASLSATERQIFAIAKGEWLAIKLLTQQVSVSDIKLLDALSQFLIEMHVYNLDDEKIDVLAWICRKLGQSNKGRYKSLLQLIAEQSAYKKLRNYAMSAYKTLPYSPSLYSIGSVDFKGILNEFKL
mgnify:CR=1 FL=1